MDVMHQLTGLVRPATLSASYAIDLRTMETQRQPLTAQSECTVCADLQPEVRS